jgi:hypothetical protein
MKPPPQILKSSLVEQYGMVCRQYITSVAWKVVLLGRKSHKAHVLDRCKEGDVSSIHMVAVVWVTRYGQELQQQYQWLAPLPTEIQEIRNSTTLIGKYVKSAPLTEYSMNVLISLVERLQLTS